MSWVTSTFNGFHFNGCEFTVQLSWMLWWPCASSYWLMFVLDHGISANNYQSFWWPLIMPVISCTLLAFRRTFCAVSARPLFFHIEATFFLREARRSWQIQNPSKKVFCWKLASQVLLLLRRVWILNWSLIIFFGARITLVNFLTVLL